MPITKDGRGAVAGKFGIELDGIMAGWVANAEGGHATSDVVVEKIGVDHLSKKHLAGVKYEEISLGCGTGMSKGFYEWIKTAFDHNYARKNGALITADYNYNELTRLTFTNALPTEIGFPALDAGSKDAAKMSIKIKPEYTRVTSTGGKSLAGAFPINAATQKKWLPANFRLNIDGLPQGSSRVNKIDAIVVKQKVIENTIGQGRDYEQEPASVEIPNLVVTLAESHSQEFSAWHESFVIKGQNGQDAEKGGTLDFLTPDLQTVLFTLTFSNLGIFKLTPEKVEAGSEQIRRLKAEMYCEDIKFDYKASTFA